MPSENVSDGLTFLVLSLAQLWHTDGIQAAPNGRRLWLLETAATEALCPRTRQALHRAVTACPALQEQPPASPHMRESVRSSAYTHSLHAFTGQTGDSPDQRAHRAAHRQLKVSKKVVAFS